MAYVFNRNQHKPETKYLERNQHYPTTNDDEFNDINDPHEYYRLRIDEALKLHKTSRDYYHDQLMANKSIRKKISKSRDEAENIKTKFERIKKVVDDYGEKIVKAEKNKNNIISELYDCKEKIKSDGNQELKVRCEQAESKIYELENKIALAEDEEDNKPYENVSSVNKNIEPDDKFQDVVSDYEKTLKLYEKNKTDLFSYVKMLTQMQKKLITLYKEKNSLIKNYDELTAMLDKVQLENKNASNENKKLLEKLKEKEINQKTTTSEEINNNSTNAMIRFQKSKKIANEEVLLPFYEYKKPNITTRKIKTSELNHIIQNTIKENLEIKPITFNMSLAPTFNQSQISVFIYPIVTSYILNSEVPTKNQSEILTNDGLVIAETHWKKILDMHKNFEEKLPKIFILTAKESSIEPNKKRQDIMLILDKKSKKIVRYNPFGKPPKKIYRQIYQIIFKGYTYTELTHVSCKDTYEHLSCIYCLEFAKRMAMKAEDDEGYTWLIDNIMEGYHGEEETFMKIEL